MGDHKWIKSTLGHGETMCAHCKATNREAAVLGMDKCPDAPTNQEAPNGQPSDH